MNINKSTKLILNNSNVQKFRLAGVLIILSFFSFCLPQIALAEEKAGLEVVISPKSPKQGDTVSVKVKKLSGIKQTPKIFFETNKLEVFDVGQWYRTFIPLTANKKSGSYELGVFYGDGKEKINFNVGETDYIVEELTLTKEVAGLKATWIEKSSVGKAVSAVSDVKYWDGKFIYPSSAKQSTPYGVKRKINGVLNEDYFHKGLDFAANEGDIVKASAKGKVILAGHTDKGFVVNGNCIFIDHGHGVISAYLHLSKILVQEGEIVKKGQEIGKVGSTGIATGPHLHWGIYVFGKPVEPELWVSQAIE